MILKKKLKYKGETTMFVLYKNGKGILCSRYWEDLVDFVEELKNLNKKFVDRRDFVVKSGNEVLYCWKRK